MATRHLRGFAAMDPAKHRRISAMGGRSHGKTATERSRDAARQRTWVRAM